MQPGRYRTQPITFGSLAGLDPARIAPAVGQMLSRHHQLVRRWDSPDQGEVLRHATYLHAELIRIHPFWDGNGRLARLVQAWLCWRYDFHAPQYLAEQRLAYYGALSRYCLYLDLEPLMALTWASLPPS